MLRRFYLTSSLMNPSGTVTKFPRARGPQWPIQPAFEPWIDWNMLQLVLQVKLCYAKLQIEIAALEESFQQDLVVVILSPGVVFTHFSM